MNIVVHVNPMTGEPVGSEDIDQTCGGLSFGEYCGGCGACIHMQAIFYGLACHTEEYEIGWYYAEFCIKGMGI